MSKRALKKYLAELRKPALEEQLLDLYERFSSVKKYYDFVFNPKEDQMIREARMKISNEYFPLKRKRPKARRSVAQKYIKHFLTLGVDPDRIADLMLYNLEIAQSFEADRKVQTAFYKSMLNSFEEALHHISFHGLLHTYKERILIVYRNAQERDWPYLGGFSRALDLIE
ncbi:MAG: DUF6155 family protein [Flavobacteriaceae bacterium]